MNNVRDVNGLKWVNQKMGVPNHPPPITTVLIWLNLFAYSCLKYKARTCNQPYTLLQFCLSKQNMKAYVFSWKYIKKNLIISSTNSLSN